jgi:hypothetical protein
MRAAGSKSRIVFGIVCIAIVLMSGMIQAAHIHRDLRTDRDCSLCMVAHSAVRAAPPIVLPHISAPVAEVEMVRRVEVPRRVVFVRLAIRPPPEAAVLFA